MLFSIIIPVYNAADHLARCVEAVLSQAAARPAAKTKAAPDESSNAAAGTKPSADIELILVDDGSADGSGELCDRYAAGDDRVKVFHKENGGQASARRVGIFASKGDYICYVDADDTVRPDWLETIAACIRSGNEPDILAFGIAEHTAAGTKEVISDLPEGLYKGVRLRKEVFPFTLSDRRKYFTTQIIYPVAWNKVYRRELLTEHYNRDERIRRGEDTAFVYECLLHAHSLYVTHKVLYDYYRDLPSSISARFGMRLTENDVYLSYYLKSRLAGLGVDRQINDFIMSKIIRSVLWKAANLPPEDAKEELRKELDATKLLRHVTFHGLPFGPSIFLFGLRLRLYGPILDLARIKQGKLRTANTGIDSNNTGSNNVGSNNADTTDTGSNDHEGMAGSRDNYSESPKPKLSFIVPVYRTEKYLPRCIDSILSQTMRELELILIDDGSPDSCPAICDDYAARDSRVRVLHQKNAGVVRARNRGLLAAGGEYVLFIDSDDYVSSYMAETICHAIEKNRCPDLVIFSFDTLYKDHSAETAPIPKAGFYSRGRIEAEILPYFISDRRGKKWWTPGIPTPLFCKAFRKAYLLNHRFTEEKIAVSEDTAQSFECVFFARSLVICPESLYYYDRTNEASVTHRYRADLAGMFAALFSHLEASIGGKNPLIDRQLNDYFAYRVLRAVNIEAEHKKPVLETSIKLQRAFEWSGLLDHVSLSGLPPIAAMLTGMMKARLFLPLLLILRAYNACKKLMAGCRLT